MANSDSDYLEINDLEVGKTYTVVNGGWYFEVLSKDTKQVHILMSNGDKSYIPLDWKDLKIIERNG